MQLKNIHLHFRSSGGETQSCYVAVFSNFQFVELFPKIPLECSFGDQLYYQDYTNWGVRVARKTIQDSSVRSSLFVKQHRRWYD